MTTPSPRVPDPTPQEIHKRCLAIQRGWNASTRWVRQHDLKREDHAAFAWQPPTVAESDVYGSGRGDGSTWIELGVLCTTPEKRE